MTKQAAIAGAGIMGLLAARELLDLGWKVHIFEKRTEADYHRSTSFAAAGMLVPFTELESSDPMTHAMGLEALELWPQIMNALGERVHFQRNGSLILTHARDRPLFDQVTQRITRQMPKEQYQWVRVADIEPELGEVFERGLYLPLEGHLDNTELMPALTRHLSRGDCRILFGERVEQLMPHIIETSKGSTIYDLVLDCRGIGAQNALPDLRGVRGEAFLVEAPAVNFQRPVKLMHPRYGIYIVPRADHRYYIGATMIESTSDAPITVRSALELLSAAYSVHKGFGEAIILNTYSGLRPALPHNEPRMFCQSGRIAINGLFRHGFLVAPSLARCLRLYLEDKPVPYAGLMQFQ
ncbi:FAD-dependent oxidoreductase [Oligoflexus tunisiensis]|uniref:FAD-dependent oxidoreductase n=1 Tax=Oligoflexus tunisiensis TaxID=708132 RepID=UPI000A90ABFD|nr:FAD-dependent oxidoreductase [Oligoflexus tunisiensis]